MPKIKDVKTFQSGYIKWKPIPGDELTGEFDGTLIVNGEVIVNGDVIEIDTTVSLGVADLFTIMNFGESGPGVVTTASNNESGIFVDRGMFSLIDDPDNPGTLIIEREGGDPSGKPIWRDDPLAQGIVLDDGTIDPAQPGPHLPQPPGSWVWSENAFAWDLAPAIDYRKDQNDNALPTLQLIEPLTGNFPRIKNLGDPIDNLDAVNYQTLLSHTLPGGTSDCDVLYYDTVSGNWVAQPLHIDCDSTPTLGGPLDINDHSITNSGIIGDITLQPGGSGSGAIVLDYGRWPLNDGSPDAFLTTDGSGNLSWKSLTSLIQPDPYDLTFYAEGQLTQPNYIFTGYISTQVFTILGDTTSNSAATCQTPPSSNVAYDILKNGSAVGIVSFSAGNTVGTVSIGTNVPMGPGDILELRTQAITDASITEIAITIEGTLTENVSLVPRDYAFYIPDNINTVGAIIGRYVVGRDFTILSDANGNSNANANTPPTVNTNYDINLNGSLIGTISFLSGNNTGFVTIGSNTSVSTGDILEVVVQAPDSFISGVSFSIEGEYDNTANENPYDIEVYHSGLLDTPSDIFNRVIISREVSLLQMINAPLANARVAPSVDVTYDILYNGSVVGGIFFAAGSNVGIINILSTITMDVGDYVDLSTQATVDNTIEDVSITLAASVFIDENPFGAVDSVTGGDGLFNDGGNITGDIILHVGAGNGISVGADTVSVIFGGTGTLDVAARSDHTHTASEITQIQFIEVTVDYTATSGDHLMLGGNVNPIVISMPASPTAGDYVRIKTANTLDWGEVSLSGNGEPINGLPDDIIMDLNNRDITLVYINSTRGWVL